MSNLEWSTTQNTSLTADSKMRGSRALVTSPKLPEPTEVLMPVELKFVWFATLNASARNSKWARSFMGKFLKTATLNDFSLGPLIVPMPVLPKKPLRGAAKADVLNHSAAVLG